MRNKVGQSGLEFMVVALVAISTMIVFLVVLNQFMVSEQHKSRIDKAQSFANGLSEEIFFAFEAQEGYTRVIDLPSSIEGKIYSLEFESFDGSANFELFIEDAVFFKLIPVIVNNLSFYSVSDSGLLISKKKEGILVEVLE